MLDAPAQWLAGSWHEWLACWLGLALLPLLPGLVELLSDGEASRQPPFKPSLVTAQYIERFGLLSMVLLIPAWRGRRASLPLTRAFLGIFGLILGLQLARIAAPHQFPYWRGVLILRMHRS